MNDAALLLTSAIAFLSVAALIADWLRPDVVGLMVMVLLGITGLTTPSETVAGFSSSATLTILSVSILAEGLTQSGVARSLSRWMKRWAGQQEGRLVLVTLFAGAIASFFMNNVAALGVLMPAVIGLARQTRSAPSRLLMPLSFGVIAGGMATLFTTSNIIVSNTLQEAGLRPFGVLDFLPVGLPVVLVTAAYMYFVGRHLLPVRYPAHMAQQMRQVRHELVETYGLGRSLVECEVEPASPLANQSIRQARWATRLGLNIVALERNGQMRPVVSSQEIIRPGDVVLAFGSAEPEACRSLGLRPLPSPDLSVYPPDPQLTLAEVVVPPHSQLDGRSLREIRFRERFNLNVLAIWRRGQPIYRHLGHATLRAGDGLLVQATLEHLHLAHQSRDLIVLEEDPEAVLHPARYRWAVWIGLIVLLVILANLVPVAMATLAGAAAMVLSGCLTMDEAYRSIDWKAIFLIAGFWPLSTALQSSGLAAELVTGFLHLSSRLSPPLILALLLAMTALFTNLMAGQSAAPILLAPIGLSIARATGLDPRALLMAVALGCSLAFPTPIGHPVNTMVMGSGGYRARDFIRVGGPLTLILFLTILAGLHLFWRI